MVMSLIRGSACDGRSSFRSGAIFCSGPSSRPLPIAMPTSADTIDFDADLMFGRLRGRVAAITLLGNRLPVPGNDHGLQRFNSSLVARAVSKVVTD